MTAVPALLCGIIGHPLGQSLSPLLHNWGFSRLGIAGRYFAWPQTPEALPAFISAVRTLPVAGVSVTIPHKERCIPLLDGLTPEARAVGAVNTLFWRDSLLLGHNTDLEGFMRPLQGLPPCACALVLGAGGAARAVVAALQALGISQIVVAARDPAKAMPLVQDFGCSVVPWEQRGAVRPSASGGLWVINTTPLGMTGKAPDQNPCPAELLALGDKSGNCLAYDLIYNPLQTHFLAQAQAAGWAVQDGLMMFVAQGAAQFRLWTGHDLPLDEARALVLEALQPVGQ